MPRDEVYLLDILNSAEWALRHVQGMDREGFLADVKTQDSIIRRLEMIGEAAGRLSDSAKGHLPQVPWRSLIGMRNLLIHDYDNVDLGVVWDTVQKDLPALVSALEPHVPKDKQP